MTDVLSRVIFYNRYLTLSVIVAATILWGLGIPGATFTTIFEDLLPYNHSIVKNYFAYRSLYGNQDSVQLVLENNSGTIYDPYFLKAVDTTTRGFELIPGVNKERISSLTSRKLRVVRTDGETIYSDPLINSNKPLPASQDELALLRASVVGTPGVLGQWVSWDQTAVLIDGALVPGASDYREVFAHLRMLADKAQETPGVRAMMLGRPVLTGWIYSFDGQVGHILLLSLLIVLVMVAVYSRSLSLVVLSSLAAALSIVWGLGLLGYLGDNLDPLVLVVPILHVARALSHSVQMGLRYQELRAVGLMRVEAGRELFRRQFTPGAFGILCDALGLFLIAIAAIPIMQKLALFVGFWTISMLVNVMMVFPIMISFLPDQGEAQKSRVLRRHPVLDALGRIAINPRGRRVTWAISIVLTLGAVVLSHRVSMGNPQPGSPLLWPESDYNQAVAFYNSKFLGVDQLTVVVKAATGDVRNLRYVDAIADLQACLEDTPEVAGSVSYVDLLPKIRQIFWGGYPKAAVRPISDQESGTYTEMLLNGASPGDFDRFFDRQYQHASVTFFLKDTATPTINAVLGNLRNGIADVESKYGIQGAFEIGLGSASLQAATNDEVHFSHYASFIGGVLLMMLTCLVAYRSLVLALTLVVPLVLTNFIVLATMALMNIGLDVNTMPIIAVGMGVGIDYGIYLMSRIVEEAGNGSVAVDKVGDAVIRALETTGSAIWLTATTMVFSVGVWYFLSDLRFQAEMGLLLALIMLINLVGALLLVPVQVMTFGRRAILSRAVGGGGLAH